ncbi:tRNA-splicing endonuclease subunit Sen2 [Sporothrix schenckii 1099-18]|uniref:tRNA-intron lyase n=1 Tax=Sporothrix schenckii 1099-18 TaxID=1397361 RepID=A0A0F2MP81_SPOSC|nr:tRNA-splicing endonuclease subunit Sen2 [Sporothrix schenckii 1099-18]KJR89976.1 tRNA-splicing endonuclease subunit Sen2 [Sporothrix schenckii 1099-18]
MAESTEPPLSGTASSSSSNGGPPDASAAAALKPSTAETASPSTIGATTSTASSQPKSPKPPKPRATAAPRQKYSLPLPLRTFPLPTFYPNNPLSLVHLVFAWVWQALLPPAAEPATVHEGVWSAATRSVHVTDRQSMNDLWCQGFYGKGSLSRSEPNWLNREKARRAAAIHAASADAGAGAGVHTVTTTSEQRTNKRREERADTKWERGRTEWEAIEQRRRDEEAAEAQTVNEADSPLNGHANGRVNALATAAPSAAQLPSPPPSPPVPAAGSKPKPPVGPLELLALPNSEAELRKATYAMAAAVPKTDVNGSAALQDLVANGTPGEGEESQSRTNGTATTATTAKPPIDSVPIEPLKRQKSVRFSPTVESTTFLHSDPPSPNHNANGVAKSTTPVVPATLTTTTTTAADIPNKEHLQLSPEEAFFLAYGVGALRVVDPATGRVLSTPQLLALCRAAAASVSLSRTPPPPPSPSHLPTATDPFLLHYAVYHHFRSLGWVPRNGIKFGVDWMLYGKGPALDHAEFGVMVLPSYDRWAAADRPAAPAPSWHWLHSVNRVLSTVFKSLVLVYVDVPPPSSATGGANGAMDDMNDITAVLGQYRIREVMVRRWSSNRNRD